MGAKLNPFTGKLDLTGDASAPSTATYITQTPDGTLSAEQALSTLASGYVKNTTGTGVLSVQATPIPVSDGGANNKASFGITIDGGGSAITTGVKGYISVPFSCTITGWEIFADASGSVVIDVWKDTYANFPPTVADTIAGSEKPTLTSAQKNQDLTLSSWTTTVTEGDTIGFNVDSASTVTKVTLVIKVTKT